MLVWAIIDPIIRNSSGLCAETHLYCPIGRMPFAATERANTNANRCGAQMGHSTGRFVAASVEYAAVALYLPVLHAEIMCFSSFIYNLYADLNSNRVARCCCCCCCCKCEVFTNSALMCAPISGSGRADKSEGARPRAWAKQWGGGRPPTRSRLRTVARACTSAGARCPRIFRSLQREHKASATGQRPITLTRPCRRGPCRRKVGEASRRERGARRTFL